MTLRMADGPVENLPPGLDAYAGYTNQSGIGMTWPQIQQIPAQHHLSISTNGSPAMVADVEPGAMSTWAGYDYGYCAVSEVNALIAEFGRPKKLWTAHYNGSAHICSPACWPGLATTADGTQWTDHGQVWDESLLADDFFDLAPAPAPTPAPTPTEGSMASAPISFKPGQTDVFQCNGVWYHKWLDAGGAHNEDVLANNDSGKPITGVTFPPQTPQMAVVGGQLVGTAEDSNQMVWFIAQGPNDGSWGVEQLP